MRAADDASPTPLSSSLLSPPKAGKLLFQSVGASAGAAEAASQSTLFYADGVRTSDYVSDVTDEPAFRALVASCAAPAVAVRGMALSAPCDKQLLVLDVSAGGVPACVHVFPAVLALAKNTAGALKWARLITDAGPQAKQLADKLGVTTARARGGVGMHGICGRGVCEEGATAEGAPSHLPPLRCPPFCSLMRKAPRWAATWARTGAR